jgi:hypothetical protein
MNAADEELASLERKRKQMRTDAKKGIVASEKYHQNEAQTAIDAAEDKAKRASRENRSQTNQAVRDSLATKREAVRAGEAKGEIIQGKTTSELAGKSNEDLLRMRLERQLNAGRASGYARMSHLSMIVFGTVEMARGRFVEGGLVAGYGLSREMIPELVKTKQFQDWVIKEAGVDPSDAVHANKIRNALNGLSPMLSRIAKSQVPAASLQRPASGGGKGRPSFGEPPQPPQ